LTYQSWIKFPEALEESVRVIYQISAKSKKYPNTLKGDISVLWKFVDFKLSFLLQNPEVEI